MTQSDKPGKEEIREWLRREISRRRPPPDIDEIRRNLGWDIPAQEREKRIRRAP